MAQRLDRLHARAGDIEVDRVGERCWTCRRCCRGWPGGTSLRAAVGVCDTEGRQERAFLHPLNGQERRPSVAGGSSGASYCRNLAGLEPSFREFVGAEGWCSIVGDLLLLEVGLRSGCIGYLTGAAAGRHGDAGPEGRPRRGAVPPVVFDPSPIASSLGGGASTGSSGRSRSEPVPGAHGRANTSAGRSATAEPGSPSRGLLAPGPRLRKVARSAPPRLSDGTGTAAKLRTCPAATPRGPTGATVASAKHSWPSRLAPCWLSES